MKHMMNLRPAPFASIKSKQKTFELRLYDEKRRLLRVNDTICFTNTETGERLDVKVEDLHIFRDFAELYKALPLLKCGYTDKDIDTASPDDMNAYYSSEEQCRYGVVGIEISLI